MPTGSRPKMMRKGVVCSADGGLIVNMTGERLNSRSRNKSSCLQRLPFIVLEYQEAVSISFGFECDRVIAHDRLIARQLQQQRDPLRIVLQHLLIARHRIE